MIIASVTEWMSFIGRFHPLAVHFPIGFLVMIVFFEILKKYKKITISTEIISISLLLTAISATVTCLLGYFLSKEGGYNGEILTEHQNQGIAFAVFAWLACLSKNGWLNSLFNFNKFIYFPSLGFATLLMMVAGHHGANLTHGETYLTENTPPPFRNWLGLPEKKTTTQTNEKSKITNVNEALVFQDIIQPIFKQKCEQCHNASKMKGELRMDEMALLQKGGKHGVIFKPNNIEESEFIKRILLPDSDEEHMPPKGKNQITENELSLMKWWVEQGAVFDKKVSQLTVNESIKPVLASLGGGLGTSSASVKQDKFDREESLLTMEVDKVEANVMETIKKSGGLILPLAQNSNYVELTYLNNPKFSDKDANLLAIAAPQTLWLKLTNTQITDNTLVFVSKLTSLTRLHLENTKITDSGLENLKTLKNLEYLNLTATNITDKGLKSIASLKNLKKIYLWKTQVSQAGVENLKKMLPNLVVELGFNENQISAYLKSAKDSISDDVYRKK